MSFSIFPEGRNKPYGGYVAFNVYKGESFPQAAPCRRSQK